MRSAKTGLPACRAPTLTHNRDRSAARRDLFGHPKGLTVLFATEMWERFSYFGMASLLVLYLVKYLLLPGQAEGVLGYAAVKGALESVFGPLEPQPLASQIFGFYTGFAYLTPILGGYLADRVLGQRAMAIIGAVLMAIGHFLMAFEALLFVALGCLILGIGAFKPNVSTQVGSLYAPDDTRRLRAYSIYYVGINIGAFLAPLVCGTLGGEARLALRLRGRRRRHADQPRDLPRRHAPPAAGRIPQPAEQPRPRVRSSAGERRAIVGLICVFALVTLFWATYDQQGNTLLLWIDDHTERAIDLGFWSGEIPTTWFLALNPLMIFIFTPILLRLWAWQARLGVEMSTIAKLSFGFACVALANVVMAGAAVGLPFGAQGEPALARRLFRRGDDRRTASRAGRPRAGLARRTRTRPVADDGACGSPRPFRATCSAAGSAASGARWTSATSS